MVLENVTEVGHGQQFFGSDFECFDQRRDGRIGGCENGERTFGAEGIDETCLNDCCFEQGVVLAFDHDVDHGLAPSGDHECHCSGNECKKMLHKTD